MTLTTTTTSHSQDIINMTPTNHAESSMEKTTHHLFTLKQHCGTAIMV